MHIISKPILRRFWTRHPKSQAPLEQWHTALSHTHATSFAALKQTFNSADWVNGYVIFDIGGNKWRVICTVVFRSQTVYIKHVLTHKEYDQWKP